MQKSELQAKAQSVFNAIVNDAPRNSGEELKAINDAFEIGIAVLDALFRIADAAEDRAATYRHVSGLQQRVR